MNTPVPDPDCGGAPMFSPVDRFVLRMRRHYSDAAGCRGLHPQVAESVARALYVAGLDGHGSLVDTYRVLTARAQTCDEIARFYRQRAQRNTPPPVVAPLELACAERLDTVAAELRTVANTLTTELAHLL